MAFSYDEDNIGEDGYSVTTLRFLVGDTTETAYSLTDAEISYLLAQEADDGYRIANASLEAINLLQLKYATRPVSESVGDASVSYGNYSAALQARADYIRKTYLASENRVGFVLTGGRTARFANNAEGITGEDAEE